MDQILSPEALDALAKNLAVKMESHKGAVGRLTDQMTQFQANDAKYKTEDAEFKKEVRAALQMMKATRIDVPLIAVGLSLVAIVFASIALIGTARASSRMSEEIRELRQHITVPNERREAQGH